MCYIYFHPTSFSSPETKCQVTFFDCCLYTCMEDQNKLKGKRVISRGIPNSIIVNPQLISSTTLILIDFFYYLVLP